MTKKLLHVGCGPNRKQNTIKHFASDEWQEIRFDIDPAVQPDVVGAMTDMSAVESGSIDAIYSSHNIEHVFPHEVDVVLREFLRVLAPQGFAVITCPDLKSICRLVVEDKLTDTAYVSPAGPITPIDMLYGHRSSLAKGNHYMAHKCGFTLSVLTRHLYKAGFGAVAGLEMPAAFALWAVARKDRLSDTEHVTFARQVLQ